MAKSNLIVISEPLTKAQASELAKRCLEAVGNCSSKRNKSDRKRNRKERWA